MPAPSYRLAVPTDAYEIAMMSRYLIEVGLRGWTWPPERVAKAIKARETNVLVAEAGRNLVAFAIMDFGDDTAHLSLLAVKPSHQRCGIGPRARRAIRYFVAVTSLEFMSMVMVHPEVPLNSNGAGLGPRR